MLCYRLAASFGISLRPPARVVASDLVSCSIHGRIKFWSLTSMSSPPSSFVLQRREPSDQSPCMLPPLLFMVFAAAGGLLDRWVLGSCLCMLHKCQTVLHWHCIPFVLPWNLHEPQWTSLKPCLQNNCIASISIPSPHPGHFSSLEVYGLCSCASSSVYSSRAAFLDSSLIHLGQLL